MKVAELLAIVSDNMPSDVSDGSIINWINYMEDEIYSIIVGNLRTDPNITTDGLSETTRYKPLTKTLDLAETQDLELENFGIRWIQMYEYYIYAQIALLKEEFGKGNNYIMLYNTKLDDFFKFYNSRYQTSRDWRG